MVQRGPRRLFQLRTEIPKLFTDQAFSKPEGRVRRAFGNPLTPEKSGQVLSGWQEGEARQDSVVPPACSFKALHECH